MLCPTCCGSVYYWACLSVPISASLSLSHTSTNVVWETHEVIGCPMPTPNKRCHCADSGQHNNSNPFCKTHDVRAEPGVTQASLPAACNCDCLSPTMLSARERESNPLMSQNHTRAQKLTKKKSCECKKTKKKPIVTNMQNIKTFEDLNNQCFRLQYTTAVHNGKYCTTRRQLRAV